MAYKDYDKSTGTSGTLRIRDYGTYVEFWIDAGQPTTNFGSLDFKWSIPGDTNNVIAVSYPAGTGWKMIKKSPSFSVGGNVTLYMPDTPTSGFGGPTTHTVAIARPPAAPTSKVPTNIGPTSMTFDIDDGSNNGASITGRYYQYSKLSNFSGASDIALPSSGTVTRNDLDPNTLYYWRGRTKNSAGYSPYSTARSATTLAAAWVKVSGVWKRAILFIKVSGTWKQVVLYGKKAGAWVIAK